MNQQNFLKKIKKAYNITIKDLGLKLESKNKNGILDIWAEMDGRPCIIDLKYSGLIDDKWAETGWDVESLHYKEKLLVQAIQYKMLVKENYNIDYSDFDFLFRRRGGAGSVLSRSKQAASRAWFRRARIRLKTGW